MKEKLNLQRQLEFKKYVMALRQQIQSKSQLKDADLEKQQFIKLQDEIVALEDLCKQYCTICYQNTNKEPSSETMQRALTYVEQVKQIFTSAKTQMISGQISREHLIEAAKIGKDNLIKVCNILQIGEYANLLLKEKQEEQPEERE
jgi:hypothetical protein